MKISIWPITTYTTNCPRCGEDLEFDPDMNENDVIQAIERHYASEHPGIIMPVTGIFWECER